MTEGNQTFYERLSLAYYSIFCSVMIFKVRKQHYIVVHYISYYTYYYNHCSTFREFMCSFNLGTYIKMVWHRQNLYVWPQRGLQYFKIYPVLNITYKRFIQEDLRFCGSILVEKTSYACPEHCPKLDACCAKWNPWLLSTAAPPAPYFPTHPGTGK